MRPDSGLPGPGAEQRERGEHERGDRSACRGEGAPLPGGSQGERHQHAQLWFVAKRAEQQPGWDRAAIDEERRCPEQPRRQKRVLPEAEVPEHERKGAERDQRRTAALTENAAGDDEIKSQRRHLEQDERDKIGEPRQNGAQENEHRRIIEELVFDAGFGDALLGGQMRRVIVSQRRRPIDGQHPGGIKAHKIGRRRPRQRDDPAMRAGDEQQKEPELEREQDPAAPPDAAPVQERAQICWRNCADRHHRLGVHLMWRRPRSRKVKTPAPIVELG